LQFLSQSNKRVCFPDWAGQISAKINSRKESALGAKKIKPVKKLQKKLVLPPDTAFAQVKKWADKNYAIVFGACAAILLAVISVWGFSAHDRSKQAQAQSDYGTLVSRLPAEGKESPADWEMVIPDLRRFISEHSGTAPALDARIELAKAFFETKRYGDAIKTGEEALNLAQAGHSLRPLIMYQLGYAYESAGKPDEAANEWTSLKQVGMQDLEREADWNLGRILEGKKEFARAAEMYQLASQAAGDYPPAALIDQQMARVKAGE
jgi:predicted negative regulator of RcsB-dependent stress response